MLILLMPIKIIARRDSITEGEITWILFKFRVTFVDHKVLTSFHIFNYKLKRNRKGTKKTNSAAKKTKTDPKKKKKITLNVIKELIQHPSIPKILKRAKQLGLRLIRSCSIKKLNWAISIDDYFVQGMLQGLISQIPKTRKISISGNFEEINAFTLRIHLSILKITGTLLLFLITFPYLDSLRLYKKIKTVS